MDRRALQWHSAGFLFEHGRALWFGIEMRCADLSILMPEQSRRMPAAASEQIRFISRTVMMHLELMRVFRVTTYRLTPLCRTVHLPWFTPRPPHVLRHATHVQLVYATLSAIRCNPIR